MSPKITNFILGVYTSICILISGYFYINPIEKKYWDKNLQHYYYYDDSANFEYSIVISIAGFVLLYSFLALFKKKQF